jgi:excinuclease UvrABC nuclease subunit
MSYRNLKQLGFSNYYSISPNKENNLFYLKNIPRVSGVYIITANKKIPRLKGGSKIIYIGKTNNLRNRIKILFKHLIPENTYKISYNHTAREGLMEIINETEYSPSIIYLEYSKPKKLESKLLLAYRKCHIETPPLNNQRK